MRICLERERTGDERDQKLKKKALNLWICGRVFVGYTNLSDVQNMPSQESIFKGTREPNGP